MSDAPRLRRDVVVGDTFLRGIFVYEVVVFARGDGEPQCRLRKSVSGYSHRPTLAEPPARYECGRVQAYPA